MGRSLENRSTPGGGKVEGERLQDLVLGNLSPEEALRVLESVEGNPAMSEELDFYIELARFAQEEGKDVFEQHRFRPEPVKWWKGFAGFTKVVREPRVVYGIASAAAVVCGLLVANAVVRDPIHDAARVDRIAYVATVRGNGGEEVGIAQKLFEGGKHREAIEELERYIRVSPRDQMNVYAHYLAGAMSLASAERSVLGLFPRYEDAAAEKALAFLGVTRGRTSNARLQEEAALLQSKALLMLGRREEAAGILRWLATGGGVRSGWADSVLVILDDAR